MNCSQREKILSIFTILLLIFTVLLFFVSVGIIWYISRDQDLTKVVAVPDDIDDLLNDVNTM